MLLKDLFVFLPKSKRSASYGKPEGKYPFFTSSNTIDKYVDEPDYNGSYLIIGDGGTGNCKYYDGEFSASDHNYIMFPKKGTNPRCVQYFLAKDNFQVLNEGFKGIGIKNVSKAYIENIDYRHNRKFSEDYICQTLGKIEELINKELSVLTSLDELTKSRFIEQFGDLNSNPNNYPMKTLNEIAEYWNGLTYKPADVSKVGQGTLVLRSSNIQNSSLAFEDNVYVNCNFKEKHYVKENDILMCSRNGSARLVGKVALIKGLETKTSFGAFMMIIRSNYYPYLKAYFENDAFRSQLATSTATINQITSKMLDAVKIPVPPMELVKDFENYTQQIDKLKFSI